MRISIVTPTYNRGKLLENLYRSLINNKNDEIDIEWLVMDDGSNDNTQSIIEGFRKENKIRIIYFKQENRGKMIAVNKLIPKATGDLIVECDSDDCFTRRCI